MKICRTVFRIFISLLIVSNIIVCSLIFTPLIGTLYEILEIKPDIQNSDAIVLLSAGHYGNGLLSRDTYHRVFQAFRLYKQGKAAKIIICGGLDDETKIPYSVVMKDLLIEIGLRDEDIITEINSTNTYENLKFAIPILKNNNINKFLLVTSSYHMYRSLKICQKLGLHAKPAPVPCYEKDLPNFIHRNRHLLIILREYCAISYFWLRGWI